MVDAPTNNMRVASLQIYPIKSLRALSPAPTTITATYTGFQYDRRFCLFNLAKGKHMAVAEYTEMCLFTQHAIPSDPSRFEVKYTLPHTFNKPDSKVDEQSTLQVSYEPDIQNLEEVTVDMHHSPAVGYDMGAKYNSWFRERFGYDVKLIYIGENRRKVLGNVAPNVATRQKGGVERGLGLKNTATSDANKENAGSGWLGGLSNMAKGVVGTVLGGKESDGVDTGIGFADVAPYLIVSKKSWENAQKRLDGEGIDILKFRPNIIVEGATEDWEEDYWAELQIGEGKFVLTQNCARCNSLNVDYNTGKVGVGESGKMLKKLQSDRRVDLGMKYSPVFGRLSFLARTAGTAEGTELKVGDEVKVLSTNEERTRFD